MKIKLFKWTWEIDKETVLKWSLIGGGGLLALCGEWVDRRIKDKRYNEKMTEEVQKQAAKLLESIKPNDENA